MTVNRLPATVAAAPVPVIATLLAAVALAGPATAQDQASTLARLAGSSTEVVAVRVLAAQDDGAEHRVRLLVTEVLAGRPAPVFELSEPAGPTCGRALHGLRAGADLVAFLDRDPAGGLRLSVPTARSLPPSGPVLLAHLRALLAAPPAEHPGLLAAALASVDPRVRRDAALALPTLRGLEGLDARGRDRILAALPGLLDTADPAVVELLVAVRRLALAGALEVLVPRYLEGRDPQLSGVVRAAIPDLGAAAAVRAIAAHQAVTPAARERAAELLVRLPGGDAARALADLLPQLSPAAAARTAGEMLSRGVPAEGLRGLLGPELLDRAAADRRSPPRFRSILQGARR